MKKKLNNIIQWIKDLLLEKFHYRNENAPYYLTILIATALFIVGLNTFIELTDELAENELNGYDKAVTEFFISFRSSSLTNFFQIVTHLGDRFAYIVLTIVLSIIFFIKFHNWKFIAQTILVLILSSLSNIVLKKVINRTRPSLEHLVSVNTLSYPSGHSMSAMAFYGFLAYLCLRFKLALWLKILSVSVLVLLIVLIGISRIYLGVHYPSDVAAGFIGGLIWVTFCVVIFNLIDLLRGNLKARNKPSE